MGIATPIGWRSACPRLHFPLDSDQSGALGGSSAYADFGNDGKLGKSMYLPNTGLAPYAYHNLGNGYTSDQYCFPAPGSCELGASFAFWMMIPGEPSLTSGYLTTMLSEGPGFAVFWSRTTGNALRILVRRDSDTKQDFIEIDKTDFIADYGFHVWVHYLTTYRFVFICSNDCSSRLSVYLSIYP